jgi:4-hydroxybutyryl-CoA dehydratase/vinylacetyl-CoA-Delta-isomerase
LIFGIWIFTEGIMALMTPDQYVDSVRAMKPRVFMNGKKVADILENKNTRTVVEANKASYVWALDPQYRDIMTAYSPLVGEVVNRYTYISASIEDLVKKAQAGTFTSEMLGTCIYRCVGYDAFHSLASTTWEMDKDRPEKRPLRRRGPHGTERKEESKNAGMAGPPPFLENRR